MNESFVGELFEQSGFVYNAIDIADGYRTSIVDLSHQSTAGRIRKTEMPN